MLAHIFKTDFLPRRSMSGFCGPARTRSDLYRPASRISRSCDSYCGLATSNIWVRSYVSAQFAPIQDDLAGIARFHCGEPLFIFVPGKSMRNHGINVETGFEHDCHFVPGFIHFTAIDTFDGQHIENNLLPVNGHFIRWNPKHRDFCTMAHVRKHFSKGSWVPRHLESHVKPFGHCELLLDIDNCISFAFTANVT